jgi:excinuclease ABC subunit B
VDIFPPDAEYPIRIEFFGDEIDRISEINVVTGEVIRFMTYAAIYPATHYAVSDDKRDAAINEIFEEMNERVKFFESQNKYIEAQRISDRVKYDMEMLREVGFCSGVENYSRVLSGRPEGSTPYTLLDYLPEDYLLFVDESHVSLPQVRGMSGGDTARKKNLIDFGFRLPSAYDNRPLKFEEFEDKINQAIFVSATPAEYEKTNSTQIVEQIIRPTGLVDPEVIVRPINGQVDDLMGEIKIRVAKNERVLVTTLTKQMAEDLTEYLKYHGIKVRYIHFNVDTMERMEIIRDLRLGTFDVLVGINLLREGLDIPEVSLVAILDADKEGFLRAETSLIQTIGRAARNADGKVIMYADKITGSMERAIFETNRRRRIQSEYNEANGIVPKTIVKGVRDLIDLGMRDDVKPGKSKKDNKRMSKKEADALIEKLTKEMREAARHLEFEKAAYIRDRIAEIRNNK